MIRCKVQSLELFLSDRYVVQDKIVLIGHSAGAHLCALTTVFLLEGEESLFIEPFKQKEIVNSIKGVIGKHVVTLQLYI